MTNHSEEFGAVGQTCDECSPCWPHRGGYGFCPCDCHPADPAADLEHAMSVIEHLQAENERLRRRDAVLDALGLRQVGWMVWEDPQDSDSWVSVDLDFEDLIHYPHRPLFTVSLSDSPVEGTR